MTVLQQIALDAIAANAGNIPRSPAVFAVGGYVNGALIPPWPDALWDEFPSSYHIRINVTGDPARGNCIDVENGDATVADVAPWIMAQRENPDPLLVYCNRSNLAACVAERNRAQAGTGTYAFMWVATLDGTITGRSMTQFAQTRNAAGQAVCDVSLISNPRLLAAMAARIGG